MTAIEKAKLPMVPIRNLLEDDFSNKILKIETKGSLDINLLYFQKMFLSLIVEIKLRL